MGLFVGCVEAVRDVGKPTVARLNGMVAGGGNELNLACDLAVASDDITIRQVGTRVGSVAAGGATQWLPITIGDRRRARCCSPASRSARRRHSSGASSTVPSRGRIST
jgi:enoyl-CoA hydratase/carnithine racemase